MFSLDLIIRNPFEALEVSRARLLSYLDHNISSLENNNPEGRYDERISESKEVRSRFFGQVTDLDRTDTVVTSKTRSVVQLTRQMQRELREHYEGLVRGTFGKKSEEYQQFFPHGLTEYNRATRAAMPALVERLHRAAARYETGLPAGAVAALQGYRTSWKELRGSQQQQLALAKNGEQLSREARAAVNECLYLNLHVICTVCRGDEKQIRHYFEQRVLGRRHHRHTETFQGLVQPQAVLNIVRLHTGAALLCLRNSGAVPLRFSLSRSTAEVTAADYREVLPGEEAELLARELGKVRSAPYLNVFNPGEGMGSFEVEVKE